MHLEMVFTDSNKRLLFLYLYFGIAIFWPSVKNCIVKNKKWIIFPESWYVDSKPNWGSVGHSSIWMNDIWMEIPTSNAMTMLWLSFRHSGFWVYWTTWEVNYHSKANHCILRICHILYQYNFVPDWCKENKDWRTVKRYTVLQEQRCEPFTKTKRQLMFFSPDFSDTLRSNGWRQDTKKFLVFKDLYCLKSTFWSALITFLLKGCVSYIFANLFCYA